MVDYTDDELLKIVADERTRSIGFEHDAELLEARERALRFIKGDMGKEMPVPEGRSAVTSSDTADAINTLMPDLMEIFTGGDDVVSFNPQGPDDVAGAQQETDYIKNVIFSQNDGFMLLYTMFYDALSQKVGVLKFWREEYPSDEERLTGQGVVAVNMAAQSAELVGLEPSQEQGDGTEPLFDAVLRAPAGSKICIEAVAPEDFTVSADTVRLRDAAYCAHRTRVRVQTLRAQGVDPELLAKLPTSNPLTRTTDQARDTASESQVSQSSPVDDDLRQVEIVEHYVRLSDGDTLGLWRVQTGAHETVLIDKERVNAIPFAALTPYIVTHRFYGQSVADLLETPQKVNTALTRMALDSGFFALNQRVELKTEEEGPFTQLDLLRNAPGAIIRSKSGNAVRPIQAGQLNFDVFGALEYFKTVSESRTGIVRNAQGLNPDTLHDTAKGAAMLAGQAQKRTRLIARVFAETGVKDLFLGIHALIREDGASHRQEAVRLRNKWVPVDPTTWGERADMTVEVGLGASGQDVEMIRSQQLVGLLKDIIQLQGGQANGPYVTKENVYNAAEKTLMSMGIKSPEMYLTAPDPNAEEQPPGPDPATLEMQSKLKLQAMQQQGEMALEAARLQHDMQLSRAKLEGEMQLAQLKAQLAADLDRSQAAGEMALKGHEIAAEAHIKALDALAGGNPTPALPNVEFGGDPG